jgi:hypothetical protein
MRARTTSGAAGVPVPRELLAEESRDAVEPLVLSEHALAGRPTDMATFVWDESQDRLHCAVRANFSAAAAGAREVDAEPCDRPSRDGLRLLAGSEEA